MQLPKETFYTHFLKFYFNQLVLTNEKLFFNIKQLLNQNSSFISSMLSI